MTQPKSRRFLDLAIDKLGDKYGDPMRIRRAMASAVVAQMLPEGVVKGGSALKLRYGNAMTRFTKDVDAARVRDEEIFIDELRANLARGWCGFTGHVIVVDPPEPDGVPARYVMDPYEIKLNYNTKPWLTVDFELGHDEIGDADEWDEVLAEDIVKAFVELGFPAPRPVKLMTLEYQLAQKIHAVSEPGNDRARDLVDIQIVLANSSVDIEKTKRLCKRIFAYRKKHQWPPVITAGVGWNSMYLEAKGDLSVLPSVDEAIAWANDLIAKIDMVFDESRRQARAAGMRPEDIARAVSEVRRERKARKKGKDHL